MATAALTTTGVYPTNDTDYWGNATNTTVSPYQEMLDLHFGGVYVHPHYYQYLDYIVSLPDIYFYLLGIYIGIVGIIGTLGNLLVVYIFCSTRSLRTPPNIFVINLALSDMAFSAINGFPLMTISAFARYWYFGKTACTIYAMIGGLTGFSSIATLACISMDRYYVIAFPFDAMRKCTKKRALMQVMCVWIWSMCLSFPPLFGFGSYIAEGVQVECSFDYVSQDVLIFSYNYIILIVGFFVPVLAIILCYIMIIRAVSSQAQQMRAKAEKMGADGAKTEKERQQNIQLAKIAAITISLFILSWSPYAIFATAGNNGYMSWVTPTTTQIPVLFAKASATWNPILYAISHPKFRGVLEERFPYLLMCKGSNIDKGDDKSEVTEVTKANLGRTDSEISTLNMGEDQGNVSSAPTGGARRRQQETHFDGEDGGTRGNTVSDVNPRAMTRAANTIFNHLVTAYEGMRVLTTSGDGSGANKVESAFTNPAFTGDHGQAMPPMGYYGYGGQMPPPPQHQVAFVPIQPGSRPTSPSPNPVYTVPMAPPGMVPYPGYYPAQPAIGQGQMAGQIPQPAECNQGLLKPPVQLNHHHQHQQQVQVHQTVQLSHQQQQQQKLQNHAVLKANQMTIEATVNIPPPDIELTSSQEDNTTKTADLSTQSNAEYADPSKTKSVRAEEQEQQQHLNYISETDENLPPPPEEFLDEMEETEESGEYNMGRVNTIKEGKGNTSEGTIETATEKVAAETTECPEENKADGQVDELKAVEEIDRAIDQTKPSNEVIPEEQHVDEQQPKDVNVIASSHDGVTDGEDVAAKAHGGNIDENHHTVWKKQDSVKYEDGFV